MLCKQEVLDDYGLLETSIDARLIKRLVDYLTLEELESLGINVPDEYKDNWVVKKEWTKENIINQLIKDAKFGKMKAEDERGISSALTTELCIAWLIILEDYNIKSSSTGYNLEFFNEILDKYSKKELKE